MPDYNAIYREKNTIYETMISREDYQGNLFHTLSQIFPINRQIVVIDSGAGTGRLARMLAPRVGKVYAFDLSKHMLEVALKELRREGGENWTVAASDHRALPVRAGLADVLVSGWSLSMVYVNNLDSWQRHIQRGLDEFCRVVKPGGIVVIIETLGTGYEEPVRFPRLEPYFAYLEAEGYQSSAIRTDFRFQSLEEARDLSQFFFGDELAHRVVEKNWVTLPECTGVWWKRVDPM